MKLEKVFVIGLGHVGLPLAISACKSGYSVVGFDIDPKVITNLEKGDAKSPDVSKLDILQLQQSHRLRFESKLEKQNEPAIFIIAVPTPLDINRKPDLTLLIKACEIISTIIFDGSLVINESTSYIGTLENLIKPKIVLESGAINLNFAVAPERIDPGNTTWDLKSTPRVLGGLDEQSVKRAYEFYNRFCEKITIVAKSEIAEASKLLENTFRLVNIALANEFSNIAEAYNLSVFEIIQAASTKPYGFMPFYPSAGVGGHCIPVDPSYLTYSADLLDVETKLIDIASEINFLNPIKIVQKIMNFFDGKIEGKKIQLVGLAYKPNVSDIRESPALELIHQLKKIGGVVTWHDPIVSEWKGQRSERLRIDIDLGIILTPHDIIDFSTWRENKVPVIDVSVGAKNYGWVKFL